MKEDKTVYNCDGTDCKNSLTVYLNDEIPEGWEEFEIRVRMINPNRTIEERRSHIKCPKCKHKFLANNEIINDFILSMKR